MRAFAAAMWLAIGMPAAPCRRRIAQPRSMDGLLMKCILVATSSRFATDLAVLYGLLCSCAHVPQGGGGACSVEGENYHILKLNAIVDSTVR